MGDKGPNFAKNKNKLKAYFERNFFKEVVSRARESHKNNSPEVTLSKWCFRVVEGGCVG